MTILTERLQLDPRWRLLLVVGFLGGYTTFSSFEWETYTAVRGGELWTGMLNVVSSVMLGYVAVSLGSMLARR
jgi:fluoride exporter